VRRLPPLWKKLGRDLLRLRAQALSAAALLALGTTLLVATLGTREALERSRDDYYRAQRLADLQLPLVRAPLGIAARAAALPGIEALEARLAVPALLSLPDLVEPLGARLLSLDDPARTAVNRPWLTAGRWPQGGASSREAVLNEAFAQARGLRPGDWLALTVRGSRERLQVVGIANSPEFVFISPPGELMPVPERYAVLWMPRAALERAAGLQGAFNELVLRLGEGARADEVAAALEALLARHGAGRALDRTRIPSARFLDQELDQLGTLASVLPPAFLAVAAFLLNLTLTRLVEAERSTLGLLKAFGLRGIEVAGGYLGFALVVSLLGSLVGMAAGVWLGRELCALYLEVYRLPVLEYQVPPSVALLALGVGLGAALLGSGLALRRVLALRPAEALSPPAPPAFRHGAGPLEALAARFDPLTRMVLRRLVGYPRRALTTVAGLGAALVLLVLSMQAPTSIDRLLQLSFGDAKRQQRTVALVEPAGADALRALERLPGVEQAEPFLLLDAVFRHDGREVSEAVYGMPALPRFERLIDVEGRPYALRDDGLTLTRGLARQLGADIGDSVLLQFTSGPRRQVAVRVVAVVDVTIGSSAYLEIAALGRLSGQPGRLSGAHLRLRADAATAFDLAVRGTPLIAGSSDVEAAYASTRRLFKQGSGMMTTMFTTFAILMAAGIAFATASVVLGEQRRDLATLMVLGYGRREASYVLLAELALLALLALPIGLLAGHHFANAFLRAMATDVFTFPPVFEPFLHLRAALIALGAVAAAALWVRRDIDHIALVDSLKSRE
jgi:putative ABC transport system permease protein